jgi:universal stress protein A
MVNRVIVGIDFSDPSRTALNRAAAWAQRLERPLVAVHILQRPIDVDGWIAMPMPDPAWFQASENHALDQLKQWILSIPNATDEVRWGSVAEELVSFADPDSLLVVAQIGHSEIEHLLFGTTAARVVRHSPCDVLVVRREKPANPGMHTSKREPISPVLSNLH